MTQEQISFLVNILYPLIVFGIGILGMYISYKKGKQDLRKMQKDKVLREVEAENAIRNAKLALELATKNAQRLDHIEPKLIMQEVQSKLMLKALLNIMKSLKAKGINGATSESMAEIENYLINN